MYRFQKKRLRFRFWLAFQLAVLLTLTFAAAAFAHHGDIEVLSNCLPSGDYRVDYVVTSWASSGDQGLHNNVTMQYILDDGQTVSLPTGTFTDANRRQFSGSFVMNGTVAGGWLKADPVGPWGSGANYDNDNAQADARSVRFIGPSQCKIDDFGDAPESYGEAYHEIVHFMTIGEIVDAEGGSQYSPGADGDDVNAQNGSADDEDGVIFVNGIGAPGSTNNQLQVSVFNHKLTRINRTVGDHFGEVSYSKNNGTNNWLGNWTEAEDPGVGPQSGRIRIANGALYLNDSPNTGQTPELRRCADLSNSWSALLSFDYSTPNTVENEDQVTVSVWTPHSGWQSLRVFRGQGSGHFEYDISNYISNNTCIKLEVNQGYGAENEYFAVDNVEIMYNVLENDGAKVYLSGWIDFNGNGLFDDAERVISDKEISNSAQLQSLTLPYNVPGNAVTGQTYARFRLSCEAGTRPNGAPGADVGEVEDYVLTIPVTPTAVPPTPTSPPSTPTNSPVPPTPTPTSVPPTPTATHTVPASGPSATPTVVAPTDVAPTATPTSPSVPNATPTNTANPLASLGDRVWKDLNRNGIQDADEHGAAGVQVNLWTDDDKNGSPDTQIAERLTGPNGLYIFENLDPSKVYIVEFVAPSDCEITLANQGNDDAADSDIDPATGLTPPITLAPGEHNATIDAGLTTTRATAAIGDYVWLDTNFDGKQDVNEKGIAGILVTLFDQNGTAIDTQLTNEIGGYLFENLAPGTYSIGFALPGGSYSISPQNNSASDLDDSDADPETGRTIATELVAGENDLSWDAGIYGVPNLVVDKVPNTALVQPGSTVVYAVTYSNNGLADALNVVLHETVPANTTFSPENSAAGWVCENGSVAAGTTCTFAIGTLPAGAVQNEPVNFAVIIDSFLSPEVHSISNVILISDGRGISGQSSKEVDVPLSAPTSIDTEQEPSSKRIFVPFIQTRSGYKTQPGAIPTLDQRVMGWGCTLLDSLLSTQPELTNLNGVQQFSQLCNTP